VSLLDEISAEATVKGPSCTVCHLISAMSESDAADLSAALANKSRYTGAQIARALSKRFDMEIADNTVNRHRRSHGAR
jgi:hypothetical protein